ncbi:hypothetical protein [Pedobacter faecalis]|uniref:hypothetical protein n=1 Tax=Pedobacter faecalis TaxID=3041495 RepID=UPI00254D536B|nr:hypothetical protein [Pedobacter sp. ELA7]
MEVFELPKKISWTTILEDMEVGGKLTVDEKTGRSTVAPRISGKIKDKYPERSYSTDRISSPGKLIVTRTK